MGGYRTLIKKACLKLDKRKRPFDWADVEAQLPDHPERPTEKQIIQEMSTAKYLRVVSDGDKDNRTKYRMRARFRDKTQRKGRERR